jgi:hypothetical protein
VNISNANKAALEAEKQAIAETIHSFTEAVENLDFAGINRAFSSEGSEFDLSLMGDALDIISIFVPKLLPAKFILELVAEYAPGIASNFITFEIVIHDINLANRNAVVATVTATEYLTVINPIPLMSPFELVNDNVIYRMRKIDERWIIDISGN